MRSGAGQPAPVTLPRQPDVIVVGCGITGAATAAALAARGARVVVLDKEAAPAAEGSGRAQGSLRVQGRHPSELALAREALDLWAAAVADDADAPGAGDDAEFARQGNLYLATRADELPLLRTLADQSHAAGLGAVRLLDPAELRRVVPAATGPQLGGLFSPYDAQAQPDSATRLWVRRAVRHGARFAYDTAVRGLLTSAGRVRGVRTARGDLLADRVVVAAGVWTPHLLAGVGLRLPLMPVALTELQTRPLPPLFAPTVRACGFGARQRPDGRLVVSAGLGARVTRRVSLYDLRGARLWLPRARDFRRSLRLRVDGRQLLREVRHRAVTHPALVPATSPEPLCDRRSVERALRRLAQVFPAATGATVERRWAGLVDLTPDGLPVVEHRAGPEGLVTVAGLSGHGLAIGPVLGEIAADLSLDGTTRHDIIPFSLNRFDGDVASPEVMI